MVVDLYKAVSSFRAIMTHHPVRERVAIYQTLSIYQKQTR